MPVDLELEGWTWFEPVPAVAEDAAERHLCRAFARCFSSADGRLVIEHLERLILNRRLSPDASDAELRHLEGQRYAIAHITTMTSRGRE